MREIIFRGKRIDNGEWVYGVPIYNQGSGKDKYDAFILKTGDEFDSNWRDNANIRSDGAGYFVIDTGIIPVIDNSISQFTGLTDKNGNKIFEGNIVHAEIGDGKYPASYEGLDKNGKIIWDYDDCRFVLYTDENGYNDLSKCDDICVIGNIHDNKELIK